MSDTLEQILAGLRIVSHPHDAVRPFRRGHRGRHPRRFQPWGPPPAGTVVHPIDLRTLSARSRGVVTAAGLRTVTRNSRCPCGSRWRFKRCCMELAR